MIDELYGSRCSCCDGGVSDSSVSVGVGIDDDLLDEILQEIYNEEVDEVSGISPTLFSVNRDYFHKAIDDGIINSANAKIDDDQEWIDALKHSADVFSLHRTANQCALLAESMVDSDGNLKSFEQFKKDTQSINKHYNQAWLRTEYDTAVLRAQMGADWKLFERDADVLSNLRWMQTTSANPREAHAVFWRNKLTLPIDDPFWNKHRPGDQWNCKCWLEQTDEEATKKEDMPPSSDMPEPKAGLKGNPAKTKEIFSQDHPHFPDKCANCHLNSDGKVHGTKGDKKVKNGDVKKGNCDKCRVANAACERITKSQGDTDADRKKRNKELYEKMKLDKEFRKVEYNEATGGLKAESIHHNSTSKGDKFFMDENDGKGYSGQELEKFCQDELFRTGHSCILMGENLPKGDGTFLTALDSIIDGRRMDIRAITENSETYRNQITSKNKQLKKWLEQTQSTTEDSVCLYFHDSSMFSDKKMLKTLESIRSSHRIMADMKINHIICVVRGLDSVKEYRIK